MDLATGHFFANEHFVAIVPDFATKVALERVFFIGERSSPMKNTPFSGGFSRPIRLKEQTLEHKKHPLFLAALAALSD